MYNLDELYTDFSKNNYSPESINVEDEENFFDICTDLMEKIEELKGRYFIKSKYESYTSKDKFEIATRISSIDDLNAELNDSYNIDGNFTTGNDPIEYTKRIAIFTEICNNAAHLIDKYIKYNSIKDKKIKEFRNKLFLLKSKGISKLINNSMGKEKNGIISGLSLDQSKRENDTVFVVDIPGTGQVSWHFPIDNIDNKTKERLLEYQYPFKIQKDSKTEDITRNTSLLTGSADKFLNIHNKIDINIPNDKEHELKMALNIYYEIKNLEHDKKEFNDGILDEDPDEKVYRRLKKSCIKHGIPSKEVFDMLLDKMVDDVFDGIKYDKEELREWRNEISGREQNDS